MDWYFKQVTNSFLKKKTFVSSPFTIPSSSYQTLLFIITVKVSRNNQLNSRLHIRRFTTWDNLTIMIYFHQTNRELTIVRFRKQSRPVSIHSFIHSFYSHLLGLGRFFSFLILYTVSRTPCMGDQSVARPLPTHKHRINAHTNIHALSGI
jgi:hypothetical protein